MYVVVVVGDSNNKVTLTKDELQKMLNDAYEKGKSDGRLWYYNGSPWYTSLTSDKITLNPTVNPNAINTTGYEYTTSVQQSSACGGCP